MNRKRTTYLDNMLAGRGHVFDIDDAVSEWHELDGDGMGLDTFLGFEFREYSAWIHFPDSLYIIVDSRRQKLEIPDLARRIRSLTDRDLLKLYDVSRETLERIISWTDASGLWDA